MPLYRFQREPTHLHEITGSGKERIAIWCDNETIFFSLRNSAVTDQSSLASRERNISFLLQDDENTFDCNIYGKTDAAIAETMTMFASLKAIRMPRTGQVCDIR